MTAAHLWGIIGCMFLPLPVAVLFIQLRKKPPEREEE